VTKVTPEVEPEPAPATVSTTPPPVPVTPAKSSRAARAAAPSPAKTEAKTEAPTTPEPLSEFGLRSLLSKVGTVHPKQVKGVIGLLETHGGHRRLSECPPSTWPAIESAARAALDQYGVKSTRGTTGDAA
jgi:hypothetical protein